MDKATTAEVVAILSSATLNYAPARIDDAQLLVWFGALSDVSASEGREAAHRWVREETRWPAPADVRNLSRVIRRECGPQRALGTGSTVTFRCARCRDVGMVEHVPGSDQWRPCKCNALAFERWSAGAYVPRLFGGAEPSPDDVLAAHTSIDAARTALRSA